MALAYDTRDLSAEALDLARKRRLVLLTVFVGLVSVAFARLVLSFDLAAVAGFAVCIVLLSVLLQPRYGVYLLFAGVMLFEGASDDPLMLPGVYLNRSLQETLHVSGAIFIPIEMFVLFTTIVWLARGAMRRHVDFRGGAFGRPMALFGLALVFGVARGLAAGADVNFTFWESRFLFAMVLSYVLAANTIRTRGHVRTLLTLIMICVSLSAIEGVWRRYALANTGALGTAPELWYSHEDVVIWGLLVMLVAAQAVFGGPRWQRILGPAALGVTCVALLVSERRAGIIAVIVAFLAFAFVLFFVKRKAFVFIVLPLLLAGAIYMPLFWNSSGTWGQPARAVRSISDPDPRDAASNAWRGLEAINVRATIAADPIVGVGFGRPFLQVVTVPSISFFEFWNYESHHDILWVWMKTGALGFVCFFVLITGGIARAAWLVKNLDDPELKTFAVVAMSAILMSVTFCYVDLGLTSSRVPIILGIALGTLGILERLRRESSDNIPSYRSLERKPS